MMTATMEKALTMVIPAHNQSGTLILRGMMQFVAPLLGTESRENRDARQPFRRGNPKRRRVLVDVDQI
jgi:hypothetical protein